MFFFKGKKQFFKKKITGIVCILLFSVFSSFAEEIIETTIDDFQHISAVPVLGYTEETHFMYGTMVLFFLKPELPSQKVQEIGVTAYGSSRGQFQFSLEPYFYFLNDKVDLWMMLKYQNWVAGFYGFGNTPDIDEYTNYKREIFYLDLKLSSDFFMPKNFKYGIKVHVENAELEFRRGFLKDLPDPHSGWRNGIGYQFLYDSRDNTNWSKHGFFVEWQQLFYSNYLGDYTFNSSSVDIRGYTTLPFGASLASGALWQRSTGDVPFDMLSGPDGIQRFRGVESRYFNGEQALILQSEIRKYLGSRLGTHVFFEGGKSGDYFSDLCRNKWHRSLGIGILLGLNVRENLFARADVSWVDFEHIGLSFYVRQAF